MDLTEFDNLDLKKIIEKNCSDCIIMGDIVLELMSVVSVAPPHENKEKYIHKFLDEHFKNFNLKLSFTQKIILLYREILSIEIFLAIQSWFIKQCCNINNIFLICPCVLGIKKWNQDYLKLFGITGIKLIECPWLTGGIPSRREDEDDPWIDTATDWQLNSIDRDFQFVNKKLKYYFNYYGGSLKYKLEKFHDIENSSFLEKDFLVCLFSTIPNGFIDYQAGFQTPITRFNSYLEQITGFLDRKMCDQILEYRKILNFNYDRNSDHQGVGNHGFIWEIDNQSSCHIIRETINDIPYTLVTEKTLKSFLHFQFPLPISGFDSIHHLEELGFQIPHSIIDYNYQKEPIFYNRVQKLCEELIRIQKTYTLHEMEDQLNDNREILQYNYNYIASGNLFRKIKNNLIRELNDQRI